MKKNKTLEYVYDQSQVHITTSVAKRRESETGKRANHATLRHRIEFNLPRRAALLGMGNSWCCPRRGGGKGSAYARTSGFEAGEDDVLKLPQLHTDAVSGCIHVGDGATFATCGEDKVAVLWNLQTRNIERVWKGHERAVNRISHSALTKLFATGSRDTTVKCWRKGQSDAVATLKGAIQTFVLLPRSS